MRNENLWRKWHFLIIFILFFFTAQLSLRGVEYADRGVDFQVIFRLAIMLATLTYCCYTFPFDLRLFFSGAITSQILLMGYFLTLAIINFNSYSIYAVLTNVAMLYIAFLLIRNFGCKTILDWYVISSFLFSLASIFVYYTMPDIGRYSYWQDFVYIQSTRMQGIAGHPNTLAIMVGVAIVLNFLRIFDKQKIKFRALMMIPLLFSLVATNSRTNLIAVLLCLTLIFILRYRIFTISTIAFLIFTCCAGLFFLLFPDAIYDALRGASRTGDIYEIFSFTGRSSIWDFVFDIAMERPFFGWGYATGAEILSESGGAVGFIVGQAHNLYLQVLLAGGVIGFCIFLYGIFHTINSLLKKGHLDLLGILVYLLFVGFTESVVFNTVANNAFLVYSIIFCGSVVYTRLDTKAIHLD